MRCRTLSSTSVFAVAAVSLLTAGCGAGSSTTAAPPTQNGALAFARCMHSHGVPNVPDPNNNGEIAKAQVVPLVSSPQFKPAQTACQHLNPGGGPGQSAAQRQVQTTATLAFARCLRSHGFPNVPDPTSSGQLTPEMLARAGIDLHQPALLPAADACVSVTHGLLTKADVARAVNDSDAGGQ
jgi:hypothetical protein